MLYTIFKCLPECDNNDRRKKMLKCTYNSYFRTSNPSLIDVLKDLHDILRFKSWHILKLNKDKLKENKN